VELLYVFIGIVFGGGIAFIISRVRNTGRGLLLVRELEILTEEKAKLEYEVRQKDDSLLELNRDLAAKTADFKNLSERYNEEKAALEKIQQKFQDALKNLANEILEEKTKKFTELNKDKLEAIINPLRENIRTFEKKVDETYIKESKERFALDKEVKRLAELNKKISEDANRLTEALKGESKTQGNWGEMILESILEKSGLEKDREYFAQESVKTDDGRRLQPDVIVRIPENRNVIIDAKVSLTAYERFINAGNEEDQEKARRNHLNSGKESYTGTQRQELPGYILPPES